MPFSCQWAGVTSANDIMDRGGTAGELTDGVRSKVKEFVTTSSRMGGL